MSRYIKIKLAGGEDALKYIDNDESTWWVLISEDNPMYQQYLESGQEATNE